jgi:CheY-like chemotaxis protein
MKKILCIDDSKNLLVTLKKRFELEIDDVVVLSAENGKEGLDLARREKPDLIILDVTMPVMNGDEVLERLKRSANLAENEFPTADIPVIILTSHGPEEKGKYLQAGAIDYITSPFDTIQLVNRV